ncbi:hypothetical protein [Kitasatospora purpeofusca]|uniref:hypothetical protein n=1 Tax=Kitasatospora purpeofusca TaxID=67352 RepID=UPI002A59B8F5|nr:hypothetical protein [Kitasatospora purpeofusca]MDY0814338.1 hypothetical protein [Kitasatospora purpeofusca]
MTDVLLCQTSATGGLAVVYVLARAVGLAPSPWWCLVVAMAVALHLVGERCWADDRRPRAALVALAVALAVAMAPYLVLGATSGWAEAQAADTYASGAMAGGLLLAGYVSRAVHVLRSGGYPPPPAAAPAPDPGRGD